MVSDGGTFRVPATINGQLTLKFVIDSGASDVSIPADVVLTLVRTETIRDTDFLGKETYRLADGSTVPSQRFVIGSLKVGDKTLENVVGSIAPVTGSLLLGQSFLSRFSSWSIDNQRQALILRSNPDAGNTVAAPIQPANSPLPTAIQPQSRFPQAEHSPVARDSTESRYLTIVYRMIKARLHETPELRVDSASKRGEVDFYVDEGGNLVGRKLINSSGSPNLDMAVMAAIAAAAPYPAPPSQPLYLTYSFGRRQDSTRPWWFESDTWSP